MATWRELINEALGGDELISNTLTEEEMDIEFSDGFGCIKGMPFTAWSDARVYFPVVYDGIEWVGSAPRDPCGEACNHMGGEQEI